jgi:hypothetical protein
MAGRLAALFIQGRVSSVEHSSPVPAAEVIFFWLEPRDLFSIRFSDFQSEPPHVGCYGAEEGAKK